MPGPATAVKLVRITNDTHPPAPGGRLVGRKWELGALGEMVTRVPAAGGALLLYGDAGIGKSALLRACAELAGAAGLRVLATTGVPAEAHLPYAGLHQLLRPVLGSADGLPAPQRRALAAAFGTEDGPAPEPFLTALAALTLLAEVAAGQPVLVAVDDVHWLDRPSQDALAFIARRVGLDPVVLVAAALAGERGPFAVAGLPELAVANLDSAAAAALLDAVAGDLGRAEREGVLQEALGNPLALVELPVAWRAAGKPAVAFAAPRLPLTARLEQAFAGRTGELPAATRDAVLIAATDAGGDLAEILAATAVLTGRPVTAGVLDPAATAGLLRFDETRVEFRHPLARSGVLAAEPVSRRQAAHAAIAAALADEPFRRAWHRAQAVTGRDDRVADDLEASCAIALRRGSASSAIQALERAAQLTTDSAGRGRRLLLAAEHAFGLGRPDAVDRLLDAAGGTALTDLDLARMEWLREIFNDGVPGDAARVLQLCDSAARALRAGDTDLALNLLLGAALRCWWSDTGPAARARVVAVAEQLPGVSADPRYAAVLGVAEPVLRCRAVLGLLDRVVLERVTDPDALRLLGMAAHAVGDPVRGGDFLDRSEAALRDQGRLGLLPHVLGMQPGIRLELGDWQRAVVAVEEGGRLAAETGQPIWGTGVLTGAARAAALRGDDAALELAARAEEASGRRRLNDLLCCVQLARGYFWAATGNHAAAFEALRRVFDPADPSHHQREAYPGLAVLAEAAVHAGRRPEARAVLAGLERTGEVTGSPLLLVHLRYARAVLADDAEAEPLYLAALSEDLTRWPWPRGRLELAYGSWLRRQRRVAESRQPLRSAVTTLDRIGATAWADRARAELRAAGERPAASPDGVREVLSAQELQIARLAAEGLSNREIGQRLYLSPRTVGSHLYRIFPKLNVTTRTQLAGRLDLRPLG